MPIRSTGYTRAVSVLDLMAADTIQRGYAFALWSTDHVREMPVTIVTLLRVVSSCVAVNAAWRNQNGINLFPGSQAIGELTIGNRRFILRFGN